MKIAIFEPHPSYGGGSERVVLDVSRHLAGRGYEFFLLHDGTGTMLPVYDGFLKGRRQMELRAFGWRTLGQSVLRAWRVARCWRGWGADLVFSSDINYLRFLALAGRLARLPVVLHLGIANPLPYRSQHFALRFFAAGIAPSAHTTEAWRIAGWPEDRLHVVPNGVDTTRFRPADNRGDLRRQLGLPEDRPIIVYVGRLVQEKGIRTLLDAFARLRLTRRHVLLVLVGSHNHDSAGPWPDEARRCGLPEDAVCFKGRQANPEDYLAAADLAVVPSEWNESFGLVVIEAMACGTPPIVSDVGILPELVGPDRPRLIFPASHAERLAERIGWWMENTAARIAIGKILPAEAARRHVLASMGAGYERVFLMALSPHGANPRQPKHQQLK
jgi:glycosyltransferase involved in cell wall biosynthesis